MNSDYSSTTNAAGTQTDQTKADNSCSCDELKQTVADKFRRAAAALDKAAIKQDENSDLGDFEQHVAQWLSQSADYIQQFDYEREQANVREHIVRNPGRSVAIAGAAGLVLGILLRRS